jgi:hypothetical protein
MFLRTFRRGRPKTIDTYYSLLETFSKHEIWLSPLIVAGLIITTRLLDVGPAVRNTYTIQLWQSWGPTGGR